MVQFFRVKDRRFNPKLAGIIWGKLFLKLILKNLRSAIVFETSQIIGKKLMSWKKLKWILERIYLIRQHTMAV